MKIYLTESDINLLVEDLGLLYNDSLLESVSEPSYKNILNAYVQESMIVKEGLLDMGLSFLKTVGSYIFALNNRLGHSFSQIPNTVVDHIYNYQFKSALNQKNGSQALTMLKKMVGITIKLMKSFAIKAFKTFGQGHPAAGAAIKTIIKPLTMAFTTGHATLGILLTLGYAAAAIGITYFIAKLAIAGIKAIFNFLFGTTEKAKTGDVGAAKSAASRMTGYSSMANRLKSQYVQKKKQEKPKK